ncbi:MAG TPA: hypothetical protein GX522_07605 [Firmicutes bacterium]|jgi:hypothetical protein|nr:hypothetical protein [Bacillota bacterium]
MKRTWVLGIVLVLVLTISAFARFGSPLQSRPSDVDNLRVVDYLVAKGISPEEFYQWRDSGKTLSALLQEKNINEDELRAEILQDRASELDSLISEGLISQKEKDARLVIMEEHMKNNWRNLSSTGRRGLCCGANNVNHRGYGMRGRRF